MNCVSSLSLRMPGKCLNSSDSFGLSMCCLDLVARTCAQIAHEREKQAEHAEEILALWHGVGHRLSDGAHRIRDRRHGVGDDEGAERDAEDDHELKGLPKHNEMAAQRQKAANQRPDGNDNADQKSQKIFSPARGVPLPPLPVMAVRACARLKCGRCRCPAVPVSRLPPQPPRSERSGLYLIRDRHSPDLLVGSSAAWPRWRSAR